MIKSSHCLYNDNFSNFMQTSIDSIYKELCCNYHGDALTTTREAWIAEINIMQGELNMKVNSIDNSLNFKQNSTENKTQDKNVVYLDNGFLNDALRIGFKDSFVRLNDDELNRYQNAINRKKRNETLGAAIGAAFAIPISFISSGIASKVHKQKFDTKTAGILSLVVAPVTLIAGYLTSRIINNKTNIDVNLPYQKYVEKIYKEV